MEDRITPVGEYIQSFIEEIEESLGKPGRRHSLYPYLKELDVYVTAQLALQVVLNHITVERPQAFYVRQIAETIQGEYRLVVFQRQAPTKFADALRITAKISGRVAQMRYMAARMRRQGIALKRWPKLIKERMGLFLLDAVIEATGIIHMVRRRNMVSRKLEVYIAPTSGTLAWFEQCNRDGELLSPYWLPFVSPPKDWKSATDGGFHTDIRARKPLVATRNREQLPELTELQEGHGDQVYSAINALQRTGWNVNTQVLDVMEHYWERDIEVAGLPSRNPPPLPEFQEPEGATPEELEEAVKAHRSELMQARRVMLVKRATALRVSLVLKIAKEYRDKTFYFMHYLDWRGRAMPLATHLQPQGDELAKALLQFSEGEPLETSEAWDWHRIHGANCWGMDKVSFEDRIEFIESRQADWLQVAEDPYVHKHWEDADEPWQFLAWCFDYAACLRSETHKSRLVIHQDATQSGIQIMSLLVRDREGGAATNCLPSGRSEAPADLYTRVAMAAHESLPEINKFLKGDYDPYGFWKDKGIPREIAKKIVMTRVYNSTLQSCQTKVQEWLDEQGDLPQWRMAYAMAKLIVHAMEDLTVQASALQDWLGKVSAIFSYNNLSVRWVTPTGFPVIHRYLQHKRRRVKLRLKGGVRRDVSMGDTIPRVDRKKAIRALAPNLIHSLDAAAMMMSMNRASAAGCKSLVAIHDSFGTTANKAAVLAREIREAFVALFEPDLLGDIKAQWEAQLPEGVRLPDLPAYGDLEVSDLRGSSYFFN